MLVVLHFSSLLNKVMVYGFNKNHKYDDSLQESEYNMKYIFTETVEWEMKDFSMPKSSIMLLHVSMHEYYMMMLPQDSFYLDLYIESLEYLNAIPSHRNYFSRDPQCLMYNNKDFIPYTNSDLECKGWSKTLSVSHFPHWVTSKDNLKKWEDVVYFLIK